MLTCLGGDSGTKGGMRKHMAGVLSVFLLLGCNSKSASNENFKAALQASYDKRPRCASWPGILPAGLNTKGVGYKEDAAKYEALRSAGLVTSQTSRKTDPFQDALGVKNEPATIVTYSIGGPNRSAWANGYEVCYAKVHITGIDNFTEPSASAGISESKVSFAYELTDMAPWTASSILQEAIPQLKSDLQQAQQKGTERMVLTNNGWKAARDLH